MSKRTSSKQPVEQIKPTELVGFHRALATWYKTHGRHDLPWRNTDNPYHIWLSEVMLQQTQVATVRDRFYTPFLTKFPTIEALARADITEVMKAWEGLGYYSRARNLHKAAQSLYAASLRGASNAEAGHNPQGRRSNPSKSQSMQLPHRLIASLSARHDDADRLELPNTLDVLLALPGIGRNTAHAILAFAYHQPVAILEANVKRVVARIFALETPSDAWLWAGAEQLLNHANPFDHNQTMMDVGSIVCTPKNPRCDACPASNICKGKAAPERYPAPKPKKQIPTREAIIHVRKDARGRLFLESREEKLLGGLYGFPQTPQAPSSRRKPGSQATRDGLRVLPEIPACAGMTAVGTVTHTYSHFKLIGQVVLETIEGTSNSKDWYSRAEIARLPLSKVDHKVLVLVDNCNTRQKKKRESHTRPRPR